MNEKKVPQLFVAATEFAFNDPSHFPWTIRGAFGFGASGKGPPCASQERPRRSVASLEWQVAHRPDTPRDR
jgi:hypothetical protein